MAINYCSLASGSSGNCHFVGSETTRILVDVGMSHRYIKKALESIGQSIDQIDGIVLTHEHIDHIKGLKTTVKKEDLKVYVNRKTFECLKEKVREEDLEKFVIFEKFVDLTLGDIQIKSFEILHDAVDPLGYRFCHGGKTLSIVTDIGAMTDSVKANILPSDFLVLESNHDVNMLLYGSYPYPLKRRIMGERGHLSNEDAAKTVFEVFKQGRLKSVVLAHLSKDNNMPELARLTMQKYLEERGVDTEYEINLDLRYRDKIGKVSRIV
jgi:phosphoribosyl 1,2-cyclic phosphodiesterase